MNIPRLIKGNPQKETERVKCKKCQKDFMSVTKKVPSTPNKPRKPCRLYNHETLENWLSPDHHVCVGKSPNKPKATEFQIYLLTYLHI